MPAEFSIKIITYVYTSSLPALTVFHATVKKKNYCIKKTFFYATLIQSHRPFPHHAPRAPNRGGGVVGQDAAEAPNCRAPVPGGGKVIGFIMLDLRSSPVAKQFYPNKIRAG